MKQSRTSFIWGLLRITIGWIFFWPFLDKLIGLGFSTEPEKSWLSGVSPTYGFLKMATHGPLSGIYQSFAGNPLVDFLFMAGLAGIGLAFLLGIGMKIASTSGVLLAFLLWSAAFPPKTDPLIDEHILYILIFIGCFQNSAGDILGFGKWWKKTSLVKKYPWLV